MVNTKQKLIIDTQNLMRKKSKHTLEESYQAKRRKRREREERKRKRRKQKNYKTTSK